jgi:hypothetical protein
VDNQTQAVLPDEATAYNNLFQGIHQRVFFNKCAAAGYYPRTPDEAQLMLEEAGKLRILKQAAQVKQAQAGSIYHYGNNALDQLLDQYGLGGSTKQAAVQEEELAARQAAAQLSADPMFYNSVLTLKSAEAQYYQQQQAQRGR